MSLGFGPVRQVGHVVRDIDTAMRHFTGVLGVGPFFVNREMAFTEFRYRGQDAPAPVCTLALAQWGDTQIELIQQHDTAPSAYREFLSAGRSGVQHFSTWYEDAQGYDAARAQALAQGLALVHEGRAGVRFCYFESGSADAPLIEFSEALHPDSRWAVDKIARASRDWDGSDPVRQLL